MGTKIRNIYSIDEKIKQINHDDEKSSSASSLLQKPTQDQKHSFYCNFKNTSKKPFLFQLRQVQCCFRKYLLLLIPFQNTTKQYKYVPNISIYIIRYQVHLFARRSISKAEAKPTARLTVICSIRTQQCKMSMHLLSKELLIQ